METYTVVLLCNIFPADVSLNSSLPICQKLCAHLKCQQEWRTVHLPYKYSQGSFLFPRLEP